MAVRMDVVQQQHAAVALRLSIRLIALRTICRAVTPLYQSSA